MKGQIAALAALLSCGMIVGCGIGTPSDGNDNLVYSTFEFKTRNQELPPVDITQLVRSQAGTIAETISFSTGATPRRSSIEGTAGTAHASSQPPTEPKVIHGLRTYVVHVKDLTPSADLGVPADGTQDWNLLVVRGDRAFRVVSGYRGGEARILAFGSADHAANLYQALKQWPVGEGYRHRYIAVSPIRADFLEITRNDAVVGLVPFMGARALLGMEGDFDPSTIVKSQGIMGKVIEAWNGLKRRKTSR